MTAAISAQQAAVSPSDDTSPDERKPTRRNFASRHGEPKLAPEQAARQSRVVNSALRAFPSSGAAIHLLDTEQPNLGRPLEMAIESVDGLQAVEAAMSRRQQVVG